MATEVTTENFEEVLKAKNITVLDFWAPWCGPCKMLGPVIDSLTENNKENNVTIAKVNVDESGTLAQKFGVRGVPTVVFLKDGVEIPSTRIVGYKDEGTFQKVINEQLGLVNS
jgi:thioredoxin 1